MRSPSYPKIQIFDLEGLRGNESKKNKIKISKS